MTAIIDYNNETDDHENIVTIVDTNHVSDTLDISDHLDLPWSQDPIISLSKLSSWPPDTQVNHSCSPPAPPAPPSCHGQPGLTGDMLTSPRRLVLMMLFSFEVDVLEISLREQLDWVDKIFIVEATTTTKGVAKPLLWSRLSLTDRFSFVDPDKIVHVVMDDNIDMERVKDDQWYHENTQTMTGVERVKHWSVSHGHLEDSDLLISADVDEVMSPSALLQLRHCQTKQVRKKKLILHLCSDPLIEYYQNFKKH